MKIPRDIGSADLIKSLKICGYSVSRQTGSHIRLTTLQNGEHHFTIPAHNPLKIGTLSSILSDISRHLDLEKDELLKRLFN